MRILVTGAKGQLGVELLAVLGHGHDVVGLDLPELDITTPEAVRVIAETRPSWVVHAAAWTDVDGCERDPQQATLVNAEGTRRVAEGCRAVGAGLVYLSTDYVFDGHKGAPYLETDPVAPRLSLCVFASRSLPPASCPLPAARCSSLRSALCAMRFAAAPCQLLAACCLLA